MSFDISSFALGHPHSYLLRYLLLIYYSFLKNDEAFWYPLTYFNSSFGVTNCRWFCKFKTWCCDDCFLSGTTTIIVILQNCGHPLAPIMNMHRKGVKRCFVAKYMIKGSLTQIFISQFVTLIVPKVVRWPWHHFLMSDWQSFWLLFWLNEH